MSRPSRIAASVALSLSLVSPVLKADDAAPAAPAAPPAAAPAAAPDAGAAAPAAAPAATPAPDAAAAAPAPAAAAPAAAPAAPEINQNQGLRDDVEDFWHYGKVARYDLAAAYGKKILGRSESPLEILQNFEAVTQDRGDSLDDWMLRWSSMDVGKDPVATQMRDASGLLVKLLMNGRLARKQDPKYIEENIQRLASGERGYLYAIEQLRASGELAVPQMIADLRDASKPDLHEPIRRALIEMGRVALNPLLATTSMTGNDTALITVISALTQMGYDISVPYIDRLREDPKQSSAVRAAADSALQQMGADLNGKKLADLFYALAEKFYYGNGPLPLDPTVQTANLWSWQDDGLSRLEVPQPIFDDLMSMREARAALQLGTGRGDALSLWLAANNKREVDLPAGAADPTNPKLSADFYNVDAGAQYVDAVLARSLQDRNSAVALKAIKSLAQIIGPSSLNSGTQPLVNAMNYADRLVRYEAAFAIAGAVPRQSFNGSEQVVPLLAEAMSQTGVPNALVVASSQDQEAKLSGYLTGYGIAGGTTGDAAVAQATSLPAIDVIVMPESLGNAEIQHVFALANRNPRLARAARVIIVASQASPWGATALADPLLSVTTATDGPALLAAVEDARKRTGGLPMDDKTATQYALQAAQILQKLTIANSPAFDLAAAEPSLLLSLGDKRPEVAEAAANVLAVLNSQSAQPAILNHALDEKTPDDVKTSFYHSLAQSCRLYGQRLDDAALDSLEKVVDSNASADVRTAAAQVRGALNLPADQAKHLIVEQQ
jgi:hypothetical protein